MKEVDFKQNLTKTMMQGNFDLYRQAWEGWDEQSKQQQQKQQEAADGMGAFLSPLDKSMDYMQKVLDEEINKDIYDSFI